MTRILLVDDDHASAEALAAFVTSHDPQAEIVGLAETGHSAVDEISHLHPDVVLTKFALDDMTAVEVIRQTQKRQHAPRVIVINPTDDPTYHRLCQRLGAEFLAKWECETKLVPEIERLHSQPSGHDKVSLLTVVALVVIALSSLLAACVTSWHYWREEARQERQFRP